MKRYICFDCNKSIDDINDYNMYAIDRPYVNLFFHKDCFNKIGGYRKMGEYCTLRQDLVYNYIIHKNKRKKNK